MAKMTIMISLMFLCLILLSSTHGEDHWREQLKKRIVRGSETDFSFWQKFFWERSTTKRTSTTTSTTTKVTTSVRRTTNGLTAANTTVIVTTASPSSSFTTFQNEALAQTNKYRAAHCASNLILDPTLITIAQAYANKLAVLNSLTHSNNKSYGENLYFSGSSQPIDINSIKGATPIDSWYGEKGQYNWDFPGFSSTTGHFTQLVWIDTKQFGIGIACTSDKKGCYIVANYSPPGNNGFQDQYKINVKKGPPCT